MSMGRTTAILWVSELYSTTAPGTMPSRGPLRGNDGIKSDTPQRRGASVTSSCGLEFSAKTSCGAASATKAKTAMLKVIDTSRVNREVPRTGIASRRFAELSRAHSRDGSGRASVIDPHTVSQKHHFRFGIDIGSVGFVLRRVCDQPRARWCAGPDQNSELGTRR